MHTYIYQSDVYCAKCIKTDFGQDYKEPDRADSDDTPCGPYSYQASDTPQHCGKCEVFLENPLTSDGEEWVKLEVELAKTDRFNEAADYLHLPVAEWEQFYSYLFS